MTRRLDLVLLHAPSVYDFRRKSILYGPVSDLVPSSAVFEMYPIGFASMAEYLERNGFHVRTVNLAVRMLNSARFDVEKQIGKLQAPVFGIDLHWLPHAHGAIEVAKIVKRLHPDSRVVMGGLSSSYYYRELLQYPEVDFVIRGDSTEEPLRQLMQAVTRGGDLAQVANLAWKDERGQLRENALSCVPDNIENVMANYYNNTVKSVIRYHDLASYMPFKHWLRYPITAVLTCRGCTQSCVICGGSAFAYKNICGRNAPVYRSPEAVVNDVRNVKRFSGGPVFILGDIRQPGDAYADELLTRLSEEGVKNRTILELFTPAPPEFMQRMGECCPGFCLEISPESHDEQVRHASGKHYSTAELEETIGAALQTSCRRVDIYFMIGVPKQTQQSVLDTIDYCEHLIQRFNADKRLAMFIGPLAPFLDPGSLGFERSEQLGYKVRFRTLEEHRQALLSPSWKYSLNYETQWMTRDQIVDVTYEAGKRLNRIKAKYGLVSQKAADETERRIDEAVRMMRFIDEVMARGNGVNWEQELANYKARIDKVSMSTVCEKSELDLPVGLLALKPWRVIWAWVSGAR